MKKDKKSPDEIKREIMHQMLKITFEEGYHNVMTLDLSKRLNSNWLTIFKFLNELEQEGLIKMIRAGKRRKVMCVSINPTILCILSDLYCELKNCDDDKSKELLNKIISSGGNYE